MWWWGAGGGCGCPDLFWDVTKLHKEGRKVLDNSFQAPVMAEINYHGWVAGSGGGGGGGGWPAGSNETKANSAHFGLNWGLAGLSLAIQRQSHQ